MNGDISVDRRIEERKNWLSEIPSYRQQADKEHLKFIFDQAEKSLKETADTSQVIVARTTTLLTLMAGLLVGAVGFLLKNWIENSDKEFYEQLTITTILTGIYVLAVAIRLAFNILGMKYYVPGAEPKDLFVKGYYDNTASKDTRMLMYYVSEISNYQERIDKNKVLNESRWRMFNQSIFMVILTPLAVVLSFWIAGLLV